MQAGDRLTPRAVYWDTSAVVSALTHDRNSSKARRALGQRARHLLSSLSYAESVSVFARLERAAEITESADELTSQLSAGHWSSVEAVPDEAVTRNLAGRWALFGADLWHLALAVTLLKDLPGLTLLTFDKALAEAAAGEGLA